MKLFFWSLLWLATAMGAPQGPPVQTLDFVRISEGMGEETRYFFENNWLAFRKVALERGYINSYSILHVQPDSAAEYDLILVTEYADSAQHAQIEDRFREVWREIRPDGPVFLNESRPRDMYQIVQSVTTTVAHRP